MKKIQLRPVPPETAKEQLLDQLETLILQGQIQPGDQLPPEREMAAAMGISRPLVHEGLVSLADRGLLTIRPRHGVIVNDFRKTGTLNLLISLISRKDHSLSEGMLLDLEAFRLHMEKDMIRLACRHRTEEDLLELEVILLEEENKDPAADGVTHAGLDFQFHLRIAMAGGNSIYPLLMNTLKSVHMDILTRFFQNRKVLPQVHRIHRKMVEALRGRDEEAAVRLIRQNDSYSSYS